MAYKLNSNYLNTGLTTNDRVREISRTPVIGEFEASIANNTETIQTPLNDSEINDFEVRKFQREALRNKKSTGNGKIDYLKSALDFKSNKEDSKLASSRKTSIQQVAQTPKAEKEEHKPPATPLMPGTRISIKQNYGVVIAKRPNVF